MLTAMTVVGGLFAYLFVICFAAAALIRLNPCDIAEDDDYFWAWLFAIAWPIGIPLISVISFMAYVFVPVAATVIDAMVNVVNWAIKPRPAKLPKAKVNK